MSVNDLIALSRESIVTVLLVAGPMLVAALIVGLAVSIFQATTQLQEQTLSFIPKIVAVLVTGVLFGPWMIRVMTDFTLRLLSNLHNYIG